MDLNAEIEGVPVSYFKEAVRLPLKRKTETISNRGVETFYWGRNPVRMRVYDKREELWKVHHADVSPLPAVLTRLEWEFHNRRCPIKTFSELPTLMNLRPFDDLQLLETSVAFDFRTDPVGATKLFTFQKLSEEFGRHDAIRILNANRNFIRDYKKHLVAGADVKERLQNSYLESTQRFFNNQRSDVQSIYGSAG